MMHICQSDISSHPALWIIYHRLKFLSHTWLRSLQHSFAIDLQILCSYLATQYPWLTIVQFVPLLVNLVSSQLQIQILYCITCGYFITHSHGFDAVQFTFHLCKILFVVILLWSDNPISHELLLHPILFTWAAGLFPIISVYRRPFSIFLESTWKSASLCWKILITWFMPWFCNVFLCNNIYTHLFKA